jgi:hypothetical protein
MTTSAGSQWISQTRSSRNHLQTSHSTIQTQHLPPTCGFSIGTCHILCFLRRPANIESGVSTYSFPIFSTTWPRNARNDAIQRLSSHVRPHSHDRCRYALAINEAFIRGIYTHEEPAIMRTCYYRHNQPSLHSGTAQRIVTKLFKMLTQRSLGSPSQPRPREQARQTALPGPRQCRKDNPSAHAQERPRSRSTAHAAPYLGRALDRQRQVHNVRLGRARAGPPPLARLLYVLSPTTSLLLRRPRAC